MEELRPGSSGSTEIRVLFVFDPWSSAILLVGGDKSGNWTRWYRTAIPKAERLYEEYLVTLDPMRRPNAPEMTRTNAGAWPDMAVYAGVCTSKSVSLGGW